MGQIYDITPFTGLDYPGELACIVWIAGCNFRCVYCHNPDIVFSRGTKEEAEVLDFLKTRQGRLTGVVFSGGEATFYSGLPDLVRKVKAMGFKTKLDTNGSNPGVVRQLVAEGLLDMVALDYKCPSHLAEKIVGTSRFQKEFRETLQFLVEESHSGKIEFEIRTTATPEILNETDIGTIINDLDVLGYRGTYWLQHVVSSGERTIGNISEPKGALDRTLLPTPKNFTLGFRNFPPEKKKTPETEAPGV